MIRRIPPTHSAPPHAPDVAAQGRGPGGYPYLVKIGVPRKEFLYPSDLTTAMGFLQNILGVDGGEEAPVGGNWDDGSTLPVPARWSLIPSEWGGQEGRGFVGVGVCDMASDALGVMLRKRIHDGDVTAASVDVTGPAFGYIKADDRIVTINGTPAAKVTLDKLVDIADGPTWKVHLVSHCVVEVESAGGQRSSLVFARRQLPLSLPAYYPGACRASGNRTGPFFSVIYLTTLVPSTHHTDQAASDPRRLGPCTCHRACRHRRSRIAALAALQPLGSSIRIAPSPPEPPATGPPARTLPRRRPPILSSAASRSPPQSPTAGTPPSRGLFQFPRHTCCSAAHGQVSATCNDARRA